MWRLRDALWTCLCLLNSGTSLFLCSIRILSVAAVICIFLVLPVNYFGQSMHHKKIQLESLEVFTIANVVERSKWYGPSLISLSLSLFNHQLSRLRYILWKCKKYSMLSLTSTYQAVAELNYLNFI